MKIPIISIILPVYNAQHSISRTIDSIIMQTMQNWELLIIDDGSTDLSLQICKDYAQKDSRIRVFHKKNEGVAMARQMGVENAVGEYSIHVDADDWIDSTMLEELHKKISETNSDIIITDFYTNIEGIDFYCIQNPRSLEPKNILYSMLEGKIFGALWNKLLRHQLYKKYNLKFFKGIDFCEDLLLLCQLLQQDKNLKITYLNKAYYHYYKNPYSITNSFTRKSYEIRLSFLFRLENILDKERDKEILEKTSFNIFTEGFIHNILSQKEIARGLVQHRKQITKLNSIKYKIGFIFLYFGFSKIAHNLIHY